MSDINTFQKHSHEIVGRYPLQQLSVIKMFQNIELFFNYKILKYINSFLEDMATTQSQGKSPRFAPTLSAYVYTCF